MRVAQALLHQAGRARQARLGLEERREVEPVVDAEQLGEVERRQEREGVLAFRDQETDRCRLIDIFR